jgi:hypothetical protein
MEHISRTIEGKDQTRAIILGELERHSVAHVHAVTAGATASVKVKGLTLLMAIQDLVQLAVTEHNASAHESMRAVAGDLLEALKDIRGERGGAKLAGKLLIIDRKKLARLINTTGDIERGNDLAGSLGCWGFFGETQAGERRGLAWFVRHDV